MKPSKGMRRDESLNDSVSGSWRYALNLSLSLGSNDIQNEDGNSYQMLVGDETYNIGKIIANNKVVLFSHSTDHDEIGIYDGYQYTAIIKSVYLGFHVENPIFGVFGYNNLGELIIVFTDSTQEYPKEDTNNLRYLNLDNLPFEIDSDLEFVNPSDISLLNLVPDFKYPIFSYRQYSYTGGSLKSGVNYYFLSYEISDGFYGDWMGCSQPVIIHNSSNLVDWEEIEGCEPGTVTSKVVELKISNIDTRYKRYKIAVLHKEGGIYTAKVVAINNTYNDVITHTGNETYEDLSIDILLTKNVQYTKAKSLAVLNNNLYLLGPQIADDLHYQKYANNIRVFWTAEDTVGLDASVDSYKNPFICFNMKGYMPGDIYAFYCRFILKNGQTSQLFHIPGRKPLATDIEPSEDETALSIYSGAKLFHLENTATEFLPGSKYGQMGYWENASEIYPDDEEFDGTVDYNDIAIPNATSEDNLRGKKVRHHKFPSFAFLKKEGVDLMSHNAGSTMFTGAVYLGSPHAYVQHDIGKVGWPVWNVPPDGPAGEIHRADDEPIYVLGFNTAICNTDDVKVLNNNKYLDTNESVIKRYHTVVEATKVVTLYYDINLTLHFHRDTTPGEQELNGVLEFLHRSADGLETVISHVQNNEFSTGSDSQVEITLDIDGHYDLNPGDSLIIQGSCWTHVHTEEDPIPVNENGDVDYNNGGFYGDCKFDVEVIEEVSTEVGTVLGIRLDNVIIPDYIKDQVDYMEILYAKRTLGNASVVSQALITDITEGTDGYYCREHSFDLLSTLASLNITHAERQVRYKYDEENASTEGNTIVYNTEVVSETDYIVEEAIAETPLVKILDSKYLQRDNAYINPSNENKEDCIYHKGDFTTDDVSSDNTIFTLANFCSFKLDVYNSFLNQQVVSTGKLIDVNDTDIFRNKIYGGDVYVNLYGITRYEGTPVEPNKDNEEDWGRGNEFWYHLYPCYSVSNIGLQHHGKELEEFNFPYFNLIDNVYGRGSAYKGIGKTDNGSKWRKIIAASGGTVVYSKDFPNWIGYNNDYSSVNDIYIIQNIFDPAIPEITSFPYRVASGLLLPAEGQFVGWRVFPVSSYIEMPKNRGIGWNLIVDNNDLLVSMKYGLFVFRKKDELDIDGNVIALGSANLFENKPDEVMYGEQEGTIGNQSMFANSQCTYGILFVDKERGRVFLYNKYKAREISALGMTKWFDYNLKYNSTDAVQGSPTYLEDFNEDNPYQGKGIQAIWDNKSERFIISKKANVLFTISYSPNLNYIQDIGFIGGWLSFHSYTPDCLFILNKELYSIKYGTVVIGEVDYIGSLLYKHNSTKGTFYGILYTCKIDLIVCNPENVNKLFDSVQWNTTVKSTSDNPTSGTFNKIVIFTNDKHSDLITLVEQTFTTGNVRKISDSWHFSMFRDVLKTKTTSLINDLNIDELSSETIAENDLETDWFKKAWFKTPYILIRLIFNNTSDKSLLLHDFSVNATPRKRF